jgi:hypothetical protein
MEISKNHWQGGSTNSWLVGIDFRIAFSGTPRFLRFLRGIAVWFTES